MVTESKWCPKPVTSRRDITRPEGIEKKRDKVKKDNWNQFIFRFIDIDMMSTNARLPIREMYETILMNYLEFQTFVEAIIEPTGSNVIYNRM